MPIRPSKANLLGVEYIICDGFSLFTAAFDLDNDPGTWERVEYFLPDETLFAVVQWEREGNTAYILQPSGEVKKYRPVSEANSAPCDDAKRILNNRARI